MSKLTITGNGNTYLPGIPPKSKFSVFVAGTIQTRTVAVQFPLTAPTAAYLAINDADETPAFTVTASTPGTVGHNLSVTIAAADGVRAALTHTVTQTGEAAEYTFLPATNAGTKSSLTTALTGTHNDLTFTARTAGTDGDSITIAYIDPSGNDAALEVEVTGTDIVVNLATGPSGTITTTATELRQAIIESAAASALVTCALHTGNDGTGVVTALSETALASGADPVIATTSAELVAYINANCAGAFTAALADAYDGSGLIEAAAEAALASGTDGTFATFASGETGTFTTTGEREFYNGSDLPGVNIAVTGSGTAPALTVIVQKMPNI